MAIREKFDRLKEEVNVDLGILAADIVGILEKTLESHPEWRESFEDLLLIARQCAMMSSCEFWVKCEGIVQCLDDRRQELPMGILKQAFTRLLFVLTRCTRLVQFQKETGYEAEHILGLHQFSDLGVYTEQILEITQELSSPSAENIVKEMQRTKSLGQEQGSIIPNKKKVGQHLNVETEALEVSTAKTPDSYRMSSWRKFPTNRKGSQSAGKPAKGKSQTSRKKHEKRSGSDGFNIENADTTPCHPPSSRLAKVGWSYWGEQQTVSYENSMICRICEVQIPVVHVEEHSRICTIADRCDLKGLTVNERLDRVAETLEKLLDSWTPKSTPRSGSSPRGTLEGASEDLTDMSPKRKNLSHKCSEDMLDPLPDADNVFVMEELNILPEISCDKNMTNTDAGTNSPSTGSLTPQSPLLTPRASQIELLLSGHRTVTELRNDQQVRANFHTHAR